MARYDTPEFISELNLDPNTWHVVGAPTPKAANANEQPPSADSLVIPGKNSQGQPVPAPGRDSVDWTVTVVGPNGQTRIVTMKPTGTGVNAANVGLAQLDWNVSGVDETIKPPTAGQTPAEQNAKVAQAQAEADAAKSRADAAAVELRKIQEDTREREYNQAHGDGYLTHEELRKAKADAAAQNLNADQLKARITEIENNNKNTQYSNQIAAQNAATSAANAATEAQRAVATEKYQQGLLDASSEDRNLNLWKFEWQKAQDEINQRNVETKQKLDALTQQQTNAINQGTLQVRGQEAAETARHNLAAEQQTAEAMRQTAASNAAQTATQAATSVFGTERQAQTAAGTVGGNLLANRATAANQVLNNIFQGAAGLSQGSAGRYGMLGGGLHAMPAGFSGEALLSGIQGYTAGMFGGQDTLDAAARMVRQAAPGAELTPYGQAAIAVIAQAYDKHNELTNSPHPDVAATRAAIQSNNGGGAAAPVTQPAVQPTVPTQAPPTPFVQSGIAEGSNRGFTAPQAQPTIVMNF